MQSHVHTLIYQAGGEKPSGFCFPVLCDLLSEAEGWNFSLTLHSMLLQSGPPSSVYGS